MLNFKTPICWVRAAIAFSFLSLPMLRAAGQSIVKVTLHRPMTVTQVREDFALFRSALTERHPDLYRYQSRDSLDGLLDSCQASLNRPMTPIEFCNVVRFVVSAVRCGHTSANFPSGILEKYAANVKMLPLGVWFSQDRAFIYCSAEQMIPAGSEVLSIDSEPVGRVYSNLMQYLPSDGLIRSKKIATLNNGAFLFLYNFVYGEKQRFTVKVKLADGNVRDFTLDAGYYEQSQCRLPQSTSAFLLNITYPDNAHALLTIRTFSNDRISGTGQNFRAFLDSAFTEFRRRSIDSLIIDVRGNGGGDDVFGALLCSYLTDQPFRYFSLLQSREKPLFTEQDHPGLAVQQPSPMAYPGKVVILTDGRTFSTAADFCAMMRSSNRAVFVGEETGGGYEGNNSGGSYRTQLPHSGIQLAIPTIRYTNAVKSPSQPGRGIIPDFTIATSISDLLSGKDAPLEKALQLRPANPAPISPR